MCEKKVGCEDRQKEGRLIEKEKESERNKKKRKRNKTRERGKAI